MVGPETSATLPRVITPLLRKELRLHENELLHAIRKAPSDMSSKSSTPVMAHDGARGKSLDQILGSFQVIVPVIGHLPIRPSEAKKIRSHHPTTGR